MYMDIQASAYSYSFSHIVFGPLRVIGSAPVMGIIYMRIVIPNSLVKMLDCTMQQPFVTPPPHTHTHTHSHTKKDLSRRYVFGLLPSLHIRHLVIPSVYF